MLEIRSIWTFTVLFWHFMTVAKLFLSGKLCEDFSEISHLFSNEERRSQAQSMDIHRLLRCSNNQNDAAKC